MSEMKNTFEENFPKLILEISCFREYQSEISTKPAKNELDKWIRLRIQASVVTGIYSGFEKLMENYADHSESNIDRTKLEHSTWHKQLLNLIFNANPKWDYGTFVILNDVLKFRHFYRHNFASDLDHEKTGRIVELVLLNFPRLIDEFKTMFKQLDSKPTSKDLDEQVDGQEKKRNRNRNHS